MGVFRYLFLLYLAFGGHLYAQKKVILDTDPSADPDDVGCMAMLHNMASIGECEILAIINSTHFKGSSLAISAINEFYNRKAIPIGDYKGYEEKIPSPAHNYDFHLSKVYPRSLNSWREALDGVALYREILASSEDSSITIVIIGTMHNFYDLLRSKGDFYSPLNGSSLVAKKVSQVVTMGGNFIDGSGYDRTNWGGSSKLCSYTEWSCLNKERNSMCKYVIDHCPSSFVASGWEVGCGDYNDANYGNVITGHGLRELDTFHILRRAYEYHFTTRGETKDISRHSNDQCALHYAVRGERNNYRLSENGKITLSKEGACNWKASDSHRQRYIQKSRDKELIANEIESLMMMKPHQPEMMLPGNPSDFHFDQSARRLTWSSAKDESKSDWVIGYHIYKDDILLSTVYGNQYQMDEVITKDLELVIKAVSSSGLESEGAQFVVK